MLQLPFVADVPEEGHGEHGFAQLGEEDIQAEELVLGEVGVQMVGDGGDDDVELTRIHDGRPPYPRICGGRAKGEKRGFHRLPAGLDFFFC